MSSNLPGRYRVPQDILANEYSIKEVVSQNVAFRVQNSRLQEQEQIAELNDRLADYIEKIAYINERNRNLSSAMEKLGVTTTPFNFAAMHDSEIAAITEAINKLEQERAYLEQQIHIEERNFADQTNKYHQALANRKTTRAEIHDLRRKFADIKAKINLLKDEINDLTDEVDRIKRENQAIAAKIADARRKLDDEVRRRNTAEIEKNARWEEWNVNRTNNGNELENLILRNKDATPEFRELTRKQLAAEIQRIRDEYHEIIRRNIAEIKMMYERDLEIVIRKMKSNEDEDLRRQARELRDKVTNLRRMLAEAEGYRANLKAQEGMYANQKLEQYSYHESIYQKGCGSLRTTQGDTNHLLAEYSMIVDINKNLDQEIAYYRKLLESVGYRNL